MMTATLIIAIAILIVTTTTLLRKEVGNRRVLAAINQAWDVLQIVKEYQESARVHHVEASHAKSDTAAAASAITKTVEEKAGELASKIESVPAKVVEVLAITNDGMIPTVPPSGTFRKDDK